MRKIGLSSVDRRVAALYTAADEARFVEQRAHHADIWMEWLKITLSGSVAAVGWSVYSTIYIGIHSSGSATDQLVGWLQAKVSALEAETAIKLLAVFATLSVAISVAVRTQPSGDGAAMEWARRRALVVAARAVAWAATLVAGLAAAWNPAGAGWSAPLALVVWLIGAVVTLISADAIRFLHRARSSEPGFDSWMRDRRIREIEDRASRWSMAPPPSPNADYRSPGDRIVGRRIMLAQTATSVLALGCILSCGATMLWWAAAADQPVIALDVVDRLWRNLVFCVPAVAGMVLLVYQFVIQSRILRDWFAALFAAAFILAFVAACIALPISAGRMGGWQTGRWVYVFVVEFAVVLAPVLYVWLGLRGRTVGRGSPWLTGRVRELAQLTVERTVAGLERRNLVAGQQRAASRRRSLPVRPGSRASVAKTQAAILRRRSWSRHTESGTVRLSANRPQLRDRSMRRSSAYQGVDRRATKEST